MPSAIRVAASEADPDEPDVTPAGLLLRADETTEIPIPSGTLVVAYMACEGA